MALLCPSLKPFLALLWTSLRCLLLPVPGATLLLAFWVKLTIAKLVFIQNEINKSFLPPSLYSSDTSLKALGGVVLLQPEAIQERQ